MVCEPCAGGVEVLELARLVVLPEPGPAPELTLEVAGRPPEAVQPRGPGVDGVDLDEPLQEPLGHARSLLGRVERGRQVVGDDVALQALHDVEGGADDALALADGEHLGHAHARGRERAQETRLAQHVVCAGGPRGARRAAQHDLGAVAAEQVGDVRAAVAERRRLDVPAADPVLVEEGAQRLEHEERRALAAFGLLLRGDDVVPGHARAR